MLRNMNTLVLELQLPVVNNSPILHTMAVRAIVDYLRMSKNTNLPLLRTAGQIKDLRTRVYRLHVHDVDYFALIIRLNWIKSIDLTYCSLPKKKGDSIKPIANSKPNKSYQLNSTLTRPVYAVSSFLNLVLAGLQIY